MKKYIIKLMTNDLNRQKRSLEYWHEMEDEHQKSRFQLKRKKSLEKKILEIERYLVRIERVL